MEALYAPLAAEGVVLQRYVFLFSAFRKADTFHVHWPDAVVMGRSRLRAIVKFLAFCISVLIFRLRGVRIVYHVHNLGSHDRHHPALEDRMWRFFLPRVDAFVHMNAASIQEMKQRWPATQNQVHEKVFLPKYPSAPRRPADQRDAVRKALQLRPEGHIFLSFGLLRRYKGLETLIAVFKELDAREPGKYELVIAGRNYTQEYGEELEAACRDYPGIRLIMRFISEDELNDLLFACDTVVMAHKNLNNSGVALKTLSADRHLLAPAKGALPELAEIVGENWITLYDELSWEVLASSIQPPSAQAVYPDLSLFEHDKLARQMHAILLPAALP